MRKHWLGIACLLFFLAWCTAFYGGHSKEYLWVAFLWVAFTGAWVVRGFFRFVGRAIGHGYRQSAK